MSAPDWIKVGDRVRFLHPDLATGAKWLGEGKPVAWLCVGAGGGVTEVHKGYAAHACPNHFESPDCVCADGGGTVPAMEPWAVVAYESDRQGVTIERAIMPSGEGENWERIPLAVRS